MELGQVQSWGYILPGTGSNGLEPVQATNTDLLLLSGFETAEQILALQQGGPHGSRLVFGYMDIVELGTYLPEWNAAYDADRDGRPDAGAPAWLGNANGAFSFLYTVKFWTPEWKAITFRMIDEQMARGYDGIFLDAVGLWNAFSAGNPFGNEVNPNAAADMAQFLRDIERHLAVDKGRPDFLIMGNTVHELFREFPDLVNLFDGLVVESSYWSAHPSDGLAFGPGPNDWFEPVRQTVEPFAVTGKPIFAVDYIPQAAYDTPYAAGSETHNFTYFQKMIEFGYVGTLTHPFQRSVEVDNFPNMVFGRAAGESVTGLDTARRDYISGGGGADTIDARAGDDVVFGGAGDDIIRGGSGVGYLRGDDGADSIVGGAQFDDINGNMGEDTASGDGGDDWVVGGKDNDRLNGDAGDDIVYGNLGDDVLIGSAGRDLVRGGQGDDVLSGDDGDDWLSGDRGADNVTGGAGADTFHTFQEAGIDRVTDFDAAQGDRVQLDPGTTYTLRQEGADTVIDMGAGNQMILMNVQSASLPQGWIFGA